MLMKLAQDPGGRATQSDREAGLLEQVYLTTLWELVKRSMEDSCFCIYWRDPHGCTSGNFERQMGMKRETVRATRNLCLTPSTFNLTFSGPAEDPSIPHGNAHELQAWTWWKGSTPSSRTASCHPLQLGNCRLVTPMYHARGQPGFPTGRSAGYLSMPQNILLEELLCKNKNVLLVSDKLDFLL